VTVLRTVYIEDDIDPRIKELAFTRSITYSAMVNELLKSGLLAYDAEGARTIADDMDERHRLMIKFREDKIAQLVAEIDAEFDIRWDKIKAALKAVRGD
jgi:hypothetical protein